MEYYGLCVFSLQNSYVEHDSFAPAEQAAEFLLLASDLPQQTEAGSK